MIYIILNMVVVMILNGQIFGRECDYGNLLSSFMIDKTLDGFSSETEISLAELLDSSITAKSHRSSFFEHVVSTSAQHQCFLDYCKMEIDRTDCFNDFKEKVSHVAKGSVTSFNHAIYGAYLNHKDAIGNPNINILHIVLTTKIPTLLEQNNFINQEGKTINCFIQPASVANYLSILNTASNMKLLILTTTENVSFYEDLFRGYNVRVVSIINPTSTDDPLANELAQNLANEQNRFNAMAGVNELLCECDKFDAMDIVHIQDLSESFLDDIQHTINVINIGYPQLAELYSARFALTGFTDKPIGPFGYSYDFCYREYLRFTSLLADVLSLHGKLVHLSGRDFPESQLDAIRYSVNSQNLGWNRDGKTFRLVILATDAPMHISGDYEGEFNLLTPGGNFPCSISDYDSPSAINTLLTENETLLLVLASTGVYSYWQQIISTHFGMRGLVVEMRTGQENEDAINMVNGINDLISRKCEGIETVISS